jgi:methionyl-tRNA formyltransferase
MGTPEFSIPSLESLLSSGHRIAAVYTRRPAKKDRGQALELTPVHRWASARELEVFTPGTFKNGKNLENLRRLEPDLIVVAAYGLILPRDLLIIPKYGCINVHPSLLPRWRGCAPLERCLMSNDTETGVCIMEIDEGLDSGGIISMTKLAIDRDSDINSIRKKLSLVGAKMLVEAMDEIEHNGKIVSRAQNSTLATFADKITQLDATINWSEDSVVSIHRKIMALNDSVGVFLVHRSNKIKLIRSDYTIQISGEQIKTPGKIADKKFSLACRDGLLRILEMQREGKKIMTTADFINGYKFEVGDSIE